MMYLKNYIAYILDDHSLFSESFANVLNRHLPFEFIHIFTHPNDLINHLRSFETDKQTFLFLDYYIKDITLSSVISDIKKFSKKHKLIVVSGISNPILLNDLISYKVDGIIHKSDSTSDIIKCVDEVINRNKFYSPYIQEILRSSESSSLKNPFTEKELQLIPYFAKGYSIEETASVMNLSPFTIATHRKKMFKKNNCKNICELVDFARKLGFLEEE